jgi:hypothetical protein
VTGPTGPTGPAVSTVFAYYYSLTTGAQTVAPNNAIAFNTAGVTSSPSTVTQTSATTFQVPTGGAYHIIYGIYARAAGNINRNGIALRRNGSATNEPGSVLPIQTNTLETGAIILSLGANDTLQLVNADVAAGLPDIVLGAARTTTAPTLPANAAFISFQKLN